MTKPHPVILDVVTYSESWKAWWIHSQPLERMATSWPPPRNPLSAAQWNKFLSGGKNGMFSFVVAFSWWAKASESTSPDLAAAADDLRWVLQQLKDILTTPPSAPSVNPSLEAPGTSRSKRKVVLTEKALTADEGFQKRFRR